MDELTKHELLSLIDLAADRSSIPEAIRHLDVLPISMRYQGVYFLCSGNEVLYVGQSINVLQRLAQHIREKWFFFDRVFYLPLPQSQLKDVEAEWIRKLQPKGNRIGL